MEPRVTLLDRDDRGRCRYRLDGGDLANDWANGVPKGLTAWCEVVVHGREVTVFGGQVWPPAWPNLFTVHPPTVQRPCRITLTDRGADLLADAEVAQ